MSQAPSDAPATVKPVPWHSIFPCPEASVESISVEALAKIIQSPLLSGKHYIVVDVRRTDFEDICVIRALNLPAHSFFQTIPTVTSLLSGVDTVIFYCNSCSAGGRGRRTAGWFADAMKKRGDAANVFYLEGGIKAWKAAYGDSDSLSTKLPPFPE